MKRWKLILIFILNFLIEYSVLSRYQIYGIVPSITIPLIIVLSMESNKESIVYYAIFQGFIQDLAFSNTLGISALLYYLISFYMYRLNKNENSYNLLFGMVSIAISLLFSKLYRLIANYIFIDRTFNLQIFNFIKEYIIEFIFMAVVFCVFRFIAIRLDKRSKRRSLL